MNKFARRMLVLIMVLMLTGCTLTNPEFVFRTPYVERDFSSEVIAEDVPEEFQRYMKDYYIYDFAYTEENYYLIYVLSESDSFSKDIKMVTFNRDFEVIHEHTFDPTYSVRFRSVEEEHVIVDWYKGSREEQIIVLNSLGEELERYTPTFYFESIDENKEFAVFKVDDNVTTYELIRYEGGSKIVLFSEQISSPHFHLIDDNYLVLYFDNDGKMNLILLNHDGEVLKNEVYENGEDVYTLKHGYMIDDEKKEKVVLYDSMGDFVWDIKGLDGKVNGFKYDDDKLILKVGDRAWYVNSKGRVTKKVSDPDILKSSSLINNKEYYDSLEVKKKDELANGVTLIQVDIPHDIQVSGLRKLYYIIDEEVVLTFGGNNNLAKLDYYNDEHIYVYEYANAYDYTAKNEHIYVLDYEGEIIDTYSVLGIGWFDGYVYYYYFDGNDLVRAYLP